MMSRRQRYLVGCTLLALVLGGTGVWWFMLGRERAKTARAHDHIDPNAAERDGRVLEVLNAAREPGVEANRRLVELYAKWANDPNAVHARRSALTLLFAEESLPLRLKGVLEAVAADSTPPDEDPLWQDIVNKLAEQWTPETFDKARDLMLMEERDRVRRALAESFTELTDSDRFASLTPEQRQALINDLIDVYPSVDAREKKRIESTLRKIAGNDVADVLAGRGIKDGHKLEIQAQYERDLQSGMRQLMSR